MRLVAATGALFVADLLLALLLPSRQAGAGTALHLDLPSLVRRSDLIVEVRVLAGRPLEVGDMLQTEYLLEVERTFKGADLAYRTLRLPGGVRADQSGCLVPGVPHLVPGEEALLFLEPESRDGLRLPAGLAQGKFAVRRGPDGKKRLVRDVSAVELLGAGHATRDGAGGGRSVVDYAEVVAAIEAASTRAAGR